MFNQEDDSVEIAAEMFDSDFDDVSAQQVIDEDDSDVEAEHLYGL